MSLKKTILDDEWVLIESAAAEPNGSTSRVFDIIRAHTVEKGIELLNRSWFLSFLRDVCGCKDGKLKGFKKPQSVEKQVIEKPVVIEQPSETVVEEPPATSTESESMSELLSAEALFCLRWLYSHGKKSSFTQIIDEGFSKGKVARASKNLLDLGVIQKKDTKHFQPFQWERILADFPDIQNPITDDDIVRMKNKPRKKEVETVATQQVTEVPKQQPKIPFPKPPVKKEKTDMDRMVDWLLDEDHVNNEITKDEVIQQLRKLGVKDSFLRAEQLIQYWYQQNALNGNPGTYSWRIMPMAQLLRISSDEEKHPIIQKPTVKNKAIVFEGQRVRIKNESKSKIDIVVNDNEIVVRVLD